MRTHRKCLALGAALLALALTGVLSGCTDYYDTRPTETPWVQQTANPPLQINKTVTDDMGDSVTVETVITNFQFSPKTMKSEGLTDQLAVKIRVVPSTTYIWTLNVDSFQAVAGKKAHRFTNLLLDTDQAKDMAAEGYPLLDDTKPGNQPMEGWIITDNVPPNSHPLLFRFHQSATQSQDIMTGANTGSFPEKNFDIPLQ